MKLLAIPEVKNTNLIEPASILRIQASSNYSKIYFVNQPETMLVSKVLAWIEHKLPPGMFIRVHRSHLVNRLYIRNMNDLQNRRLELINGESVTVSRRKNAALRNVTGGI